MVATEREARFRAVFLKKIAQLKEEDASEKTRWPFPRPIHRTDYITNEENKVFLEPHRAIDIGLPLIYFVSRTGPIALSTKGIFFRDIEGKVGTCPWSALDFVAGRNLELDDYTIQLGKDLDLVLAELKLVAKQYATPTLPILGSGMICFSVWMLYRYFAGVPATWRGTFIWLFFSGILAVYWLAWWRKRFMTRYFLSACPEWYTLLYILPGKTRIHVGLNRGIQDIVVCIKIALQIYRLQVEKYGTA